MKMFIDYFNKIIVNLKQELITDYFNKVNRETNQKFNSIYYLGNIYYSTNLVLLNNFKKNFISNTYINYINSFEEIKLVLDSYTKKINLINNCLSKIIIKSKYRDNFIELFPSAWSEIIYKKNIKGSNKYKEFLSPEEEKEFTETITYLLGLRIILK